MKKLLWAASACCLILSTGANLAHAQENWTEIGMYGFATSLNGESVLGNVTSDVDVPFSDILENLDFGIMGYAEHRRGKWSFIGDVFYSEISVDSTLASNNILTVTLDAKIKQLMAEGFIGYRVFEQSYETSRLGMDLLAGARYNSLDVEVGLQATLLGLTAARSRKRNEDWLDGVLGVRVQYGHDDGWGLSGWADVGAGSDSRSYQFAGFVNYRFENNIKLFGGYRIFIIDYETGSGSSRFEIDVDYAGPMLGVSYRF